MNRSESIKELATSLAKAQAAMEGAKKSANNPHFRSKYADLASVTEAVSAAHSHGLSYVQVAHDKESAAAVETIILHSSGEWMSAGVVSVPVSKHDAHGFGSALTYARRYSLSAAFGIAPEDDDGNAAASAGPVKTSAAGPPSGSAAEVKKDAFDALPAKQQEAVRKMAAEAIALLDEGRDLDAYGYLRNQRLEVEERMGIEWLLSSKQRTALKKAAEDWKRQLEGAKH